MYSVSVSTQVPIGCCYLCGGGSVGEQVLEGCRGGGVDTQLSFLEGLPISCEGRWQSVEMPVLASNVLCCCPVNGHSANSIT